MSITSSFAKMVLVILQIVSLISLHAQVNLITPTEVTTPGTFNLPYTLENGVKVFKLVAEPVVKTIYNAQDNLQEKFVKKHNRYTGPTMTLPFDSQKINGWGYNGSIPSPTIIVYEGDEVRISVQNKLSEPTTVHCMV